MRVWSFVNIKQCGRSCIGRDDALVFDENGKVFGNTTYYKKPDVEANGVLSGLTAVQALWYNRGPVCCYIDYDVNALHINNICKGDGYAPSGFHAIGRERTVLWAYDATQILFEFARLCVLDVLGHDIPAVIREYLTTLNPSLREGALVAAQDTANLYVHPGTRMTAKSRESWDDRRRRELAAEAAYNVIDYDPKIIALRCTYGEASYAAAKREIATVAMRAVGCARESYWRLHSTASQSPWFHDKDSAENRLLEKMLLDGVPTNLEYAEGRNLVSAVRLLSRSKHD